MLEIIGLVLAVVFVVLKLTKVIKWSWWWIIVPLLPFLIGFVIGFAGAV